MTEEPNLGEKTIVVNVTSRSKEDWSKKFSPFFLGPIDIQPLDKVYESKNFENAWQYSKYHQDFKDEKEYIEWAEEGFANPKAVRFPMGPGSKPKYSLYKGE
mmetsp:Transcript_14008/g.11981  ORF Transcript_14008/g.11981 Transcript_14008/m.11981 type:complete len:102 (+) Transcript_14008:53-358(+)